MAAALILIEPVVASGDGTQQLQRLLTLIEVSACLVWRALPVPVARVRVPLSVPSDR
jgi:hypothetical protein